MTHQHLPRNGPERELLRQRGQFWTPFWVAEAMVAYVAGVRDSVTIFDPAVGAGAFFLAAKAFARESGKRLALAGTEIDPTALEQAIANGLSYDDLKEVRIADFLLVPSEHRFDAIVGNPPYVRHHRLSKETKGYLRSLVLQTIHSSLDGRAGLHVYFLIHALTLLEKQGHLAFIVPADICEGVFARKLWRWIVSKYRLDAVVTFAADASPFPGVDTNPLIVMVSNDLPKSTFLWARCLEQNTPELKRWVSNGFSLEGLVSLSVTRRELEEGLATGFSRPAVSNSERSIALGELAYVMRGIATGANEYFLLTSERALELEIPRNYLFSAVARTRDIAENEITEDTMRRLESKGRPTLLLNLDGRPFQAYPPSVQRYIAYGETLGLHKRALISTRKPWYKMEQRLVPPILFAYLGRRNSRFILNKAGVLPLTGFLCVYPRMSSPQAVAQLWTALQHPVTIENLSLVGKSYGGSAIKVEPRALERLPIPLEAFTDGVPVRTLKLENLRLPL